MSKPSKTPNIGPHTAIRKVASEHRLRGIGTVRYSAQQVGNDVFIFADLWDADAAGGGAAAAPGADGIADQVIQLVGVTLADLDNDGSFIVGLT